MRDKTEELRAAVEEWQHRADAADAARATAAALTAVEAAEAPSASRPPSCRSISRQSSTCRSDAAEAVSAQRQRESSSELSPALVAAATVAAAAPIHVGRPMLTTGFLDGTHPIVDAYELKVLECGWSDAMTIDMNRHLPSKHCWHVRKQHRCQ